MLMNRLGRINGMDTLDTHGVYGLENIGTRNHVTYSCNRELIGALHGLDGGGKASMEAQKDVIRETLGVVSTVGNCFYGAWTLGLFI